MTVPSALPAVLMARPHPFVAAAMRDLLSKLGWRPLGPDAEGPGVAPIGIVISLALQSSVPQSAIEVYERVRTTYPRTPIVFASLADTSNILAGLERSLERVEQPLHLTTVHDNEAGGQGTALFLTKADIEQHPARVQSVLRLLFRR